MNKFLDLSEHNNVLDYDYLSKSGLKGVIIKASEGVTFTDSSFSYKYLELKRCNIKTGFYHFLVVTSTPEKQAEHFYELIADKQMDIVPVLDVESYELKLQAENYCVRFLQKFKELSGLDMLIYSGRCYIEEHFTCKFITNHKWWVADYGDSKPVFATDVVAWQYTDNCKDYSSVVGGVDCSLLYDEDSFYLETQTKFETKIEDVDVDVLELQQELNIQGFKDVNGYSLDEDGKAGKLTLSACPVLRKGAKGNITKWVQKFLCIKQDGDFGGITEKSVKLFQDMEGLLIDGVVGKHTWSHFLDVNTNEY